MENPNQRPDLVYKIVQETIYPVPEHNENQQQTIQQHLKNLVALKEWEQRRLLTATSPPPNTADEYPNLTPKNQATRQKGTRNSRSSRQVPTPSHSTGSGEESL